MSQLGMMVIAIGLSSYNLALFHLVNHAFYKALLFLGAGAVIHAVGDNQDFRKYGGLKAFLPLTYSVMLIASLSLVAFPAELFRKLLKWGQSPNSGDTLKLLVPNYIRKGISGRSNYPCTVISQKISCNTEMGYRGSKSVGLSNTTVKEQRVDGG
jgi:hypothetical protein